MWRKPYRRPEPAPEPKTPNALIEMLAAEFEEKEYLGPILRRDDHLESAAIPVRASANMEASS
jgi:hypothetical protein